MNITSKIKLELEQRARQTRDVHERLRLCVVLARSEGMSPESIAQAHRISVKSVYRYLLEYENEAKTQHDLRGGSQSRLNAEQTNELVEYLQKTTYRHVKEICKYVEAKYEIVYSISGMTFWLKEHEFSYKLPIKVPGKLDPEKQEAFIKIYKELKLKLGENEDIYFMDAVHPEFQSKAVCGWIKKRDNKTLPTTNHQKRMHFIGAMTLKKMEVMAREYQKVDAESVIDFLKALETASKGRTIHLICDNGRSNKNKKIDEYLKTSKIEIHYLPAYSPNLNPIERLWKVMREKKTYNKCYENFADFSTAIRKFFFEDIPQIKVELTKKINDNFQRIKINTIILANP